MKYLLSLSLVAILAMSTATNASTFDSSMATIQKSGAKSAKVEIGSKNYTTPVSFADGADWSSVKDHYEVDPSVVCMLKAHKTTLSIGADGGASFTKKK